MNSWQSSHWYRKMLGEDEDAWVNYKSGDGVEFNAYERQLCPMACSNLKQLLDYHPDARIVISSTWRMGREVEWFNRLFKHFKIIKEDKVIGKTPSLNTERGFEISHWLDKHPELNIKEFVILDDDGDMGPYYGTKNFVQTDGRVGFDYRKMEEVDKLFAKFTIERKDIVAGKFYKMYSKPRYVNYYLDGEVVSYTNKDGTVSRDVTVFKGDLFAEVADDV